MIYAQWLANEYQSWVAALQESTVHNFKDHPMVKRMLGDFEWPGPWTGNIDLELLEKIDNIGRASPCELSGPAWRMIYYADSVLERKPKSIVEIGGGVGEFYAILRALGYTGHYHIFDLPEVKAFQAVYLREVERQTGLELPFYQYPKSYEFCVSFYALGEFDDGLKSWYVENVVKRCQHGFVIWNPHSGASEHVPFACDIAEEDPLMAPGNKRLTW